MPEDSKKNDKKSAKEQRKPRQRHQHNKIDKKTEESQNAPRVTQKPPVYESPPPEFYKNLKRETDEILKITEEENSKYKKKEIHSNWSKYEVPIESYEEIDAQENLGADYEKLIEAPLSLGGHFQFKHEKSWDINTCSSQYDKYFDINMDDLNIALCAIPFYERNQIEHSLFSESDILTMNNRSTRYKQKYYNDKTFTTPELEAQDKILNNLRDNLKIDEDTIKNNTDVSSNDIEIKREITSDLPSQAANIDLTIKNKPVHTIDSNKIFDDNILDTQKTESPIKHKVTSQIDINEHDDYIFLNTNMTRKSEVEISEGSSSAPNVKVEHRVVVKKPLAHEMKPITPQSNSIVTQETSKSPILAETPVETKKNTVIESPEDLEKWLDDFLDG